MRRLSQVILFLLFAATAFSQKSPHGSNFTLSCKDCHKTSGWDFDVKEATFNHNETRFPLAGRHTGTGCRECHASLEFSKAPSDCNACHADIHEQTVGNDCGRCHTPVSWMVYNINQLHEQGRFPLLGAHRTAECRDCHTNLLSPGLPAPSLLRFDVLGIECYGCHKDNYEAATKPNHVQGNYSKNCTDCHTMNSFTWQGAGINHDFFPLRDGHSIEDCFKCHTSGTFEKIPSECVSCHRPDYESTANPSHNALGFSTDCKQCHSLSPGWKPAEYKDHDVLSFPIYSGKHKGEWDKCSDCHTNPANYKQFTCTDCHEHSKGNTDGEHEGVNGYIYNSEACYACHPRGTAEDGFDHGKSAFPLTGAHTTTGCAECHTAGYSGTTTVCSGCHTPQYNQSLNPNHTELGLPNDCAQCHTTAPDWQPASFPIHDNYYKLEGAHVPIANECAKCHNGNYINSPNTCYACHTVDYTQSNNPSHTAAQFPTTCEDCHSQLAWAPSTMDHDGKYFPIYSGKHNGEWSNCADCHTTPGNFALYSCIDCHDHNKADMDSEHQGVGGYIYNSVACFECHPRGTADEGFNHNTSGFPLTGGHAITDCAACHANGYAGTTTVCADCHTSNYNQSVNPGHVALGIPNDCATCHTANPGWAPASFAIHNNYYVLQGAHVAIANECATCHQGNYVNSPNTCYGCHAQAYNQATNPDHAASQFPTECQTCHSQSAWIPASFDHNTVYPLTGAHAAIAGNCNTCHANGYSNTPNTCAGCHQPDYNQSVNPNHTSLAIPNDCALCHTTNPGWQPASFPIHNNYYVLAGAHAAISNQCATCHNGNYTSTPNTCAGCHMAEYNQATDPNHVSAQFPVTCEVCHTQNAWSPSTFNHDSQYFPIYSGKHNGEWDVCADCHPNASNYQVFTCTTSCHPQGSTNSEHQGIAGYSYNSAACYSCHPNGSGDSMIRNGLQKTN